MRLHRIRLEDVRGIDAVDVAFADHGVTVVEAPNESGKTTLMDAVDVVLNHKDSTRKQQVRALQPTGRDVGSLVELDLTCGGSRLTIRKRFNKDRMTELEIHAPTRRHLTGDDAHEALRRILEGSTDLALFEALRFRQGRSLDSLSLAGSGSLASRLDEIAGGSGETGDDALLARVRTEYARYYTPSGQDGTALRSADAAVDAAQAHVIDLRGRLRAVVVDANRLTELDREHAALLGTLAELEPSLLEHRRRSERVRSLREELRTREARAEVADGQVERAERDVAEREELAGRIDALQVTVEQHAPAVELATAQLEAHERRDAACELEVATAEAHERAARVDLDEARAAADLGRRREELAQLVARQERIDAALAGASDAEAHLDARPISDDQVQQIRAAADRVRLAASRLDDAAPTVTLRAYRELEVLVDGIEQTVDGDEVQRSVADHATIDVPGVLRIEVHAGSSLAERQQQLDAARRDLQTACAEVGVDDLADAEHRLRTGEQHRRTLVDRDATIARELAGWTRDELADRIRTRSAQLRDLEDRFAVAAASGDEAAAPQLTFAVDAEAAVGRLAEVEARDIAARDAAEQARSERAGLAQQVERLRGEVRLAAAALEARQLELGEQQTRLRAARGRVSDDDLHAAALHAVHRAEAAHRAVDATRRELQDFDADRVEMLAGNAEERAKQARADLARVRDERMQLRARVEVRGGEGIGEALGQATAELERARDAAARLRRRATAAATLRDAFERARDDTYAAYREPLRDRIVGAGRVVFGDSLDVDLDDELRVVTRHLDGVTLGWEQLSAGAQEQLAILTAVAAADLAGGGADGGVPLVLDDTLGYTDAERLERLGAVLGRVRGPQVIVLTCVGERFRAIGGATVVRLSDQVRRAGPDAAGADTRDGSAVA